MLCYEGERSIALNKTINTKNCTVIAINEPMSSSNSVGSGEAAHNTVPQLSAQAVL
jgi:hypothetical protein